ncbi:resistance to homoserine/threonine (RhtB) family protein [Paenibacillus tianmuensis]|uniref:Resistance to homoserine/threonine (RhtB) family protein n=1 Tax=Paenibacillus tianmuensis TaxID=624147 RepID=A0A1G4SH80_9BACL|nr:LysE family translocator [Paenibacillus tianmuensis]SCW68277.1 resistance to homoserine/threonine (RhtB) family protein [Paenibacillus tianmuensis]
MFGIHHYFLFVIAGILLIVTPGSDTMYIIARSVAQGRRAGIWSTMGIAAGTLIHTLLAALGLSFLLAKSLVLFTVIKMIGVAYLIYLGITMIVSKSSAIAPDSGSVELMSTRKIFVQGMITNITNPKVALFFIAFLPQFVDNQAHSPLPFAILGATFIFTGMLWSSLLSYLAAFATGKLRRNLKIGLWLNRITGGVFILMGANLFRAKISN